MKKILIVTVAAVSFFGCSRKKETAFAAPIPEKTDLLKRAERIAQPKKEEWQNREVYRTTNGTVTSNSAGTASGAGKKWSNKKKGVIIGATAGAITGAVVSKKRAKGALFGGLIGAGVGLAGGAVLDKKEGQ